MYSKERSGYLDTVSALRQISIDLMAYGITVVGAKEWKTSDGKSHYHILMQSNTTMDPAADTHPVSIIMKADSTLASEGFNDGGGTLRIWVTTPVQVEINSDFDGSSDTGSDEDEGYITVAEDPEFDSTSYDGLSGSLQAKSANKAFIDWDFGGNTNIVSPRTYPCSYRISYTHRGIMLYFWREGSDHIGSKFSWFSIQRPIDEDGRVLDIGKMPIHCVYWRNQEVNRFVIRELDINRPSPPRTASDNTEDSVKIMNIEEQVSTTPYGKYVLSFANNVNTPRYTYPEQLDLFGWLSADVISQNLNVDIVVFGGRKKYRAMTANGPYNTKMRIMMLIAEQFKDGEDAEGNPIYTDTAPPPPTQSEDGVTFFNEELALFPEPTIDDNIFTNANPTGG